MEALGKFGEHSKSKSFSRLRLKLLLRFFFALQISRVQTRYTHTKHEQIPNFTSQTQWMSLSERRPINGFHGEAISK